MSRTVSRQQLIGVFLLGLSSHQVTIARVGKHHFDHMWTNVLQLCSLLTSQPFCFQIFQDAKEMTTASDTAIFRLHAGHANGAIHAVLRRGTGQTSFPRMFCFPPNNTVENHKCPPTVFGMAYPFVSCPIIPINSFHPTLHRSSTSAA